MTNIGLNIHSNMLCDRLLLCFAGLGIFFAWRNRKAVYGIVARASILVAFVYIVDFGVFLPATDA
jgi:hypothetical protein